MSDQEARKKMDAVQVTIKEAATLAGLPMAVTAAEPVRDLPWFIVQIEPQRENTAVAHMVGRRFAPYCPVVRKEVRAGRAMRKVLRPMFPGYLFLQFSIARDRDRVYSMPGVRGLLKRPGDQFAVVTADDIDFIKSQEKEALDPGAELRGKLAPYAEGDLVRIKNGPFASFNGTIWQLDENERIKVLIDIFARQTPVDVTVDDIEPL
jgi:transcriptional antiterminator RfaH